MGLGAGSQESVFLRIGYRSRRGSGKVYPVNPRDRANQFVLILIIVVLAWAVSFRLTAQPISEIECGFIKDNKDMFCLVKVETLEALVRERLRAVEEAKKCGRWQES
jgi:hypothetical protein